MSDFLRRNPHEAHLQGGPSFPKQQLTVDELVLRLQQFQGDGLGYVPVWLQTTILRGDTGEPEPDQAYRVVCAKGVVTIFGGEEL